MVRQVLLIEQFPSLVRDCLISFMPATANLQFEFTTWDSPLRERLRGCQAMLIVAVSVPMVSRAIELFRWLREHPISIPTFAVIGSEVHDDVLDTVSQTADDFVLWPLREHELTCRLKRILGSFTSGDDVEAAHGHITEVLGMGQLVGRDPAFIRTIQTIPTVAESGLPVLITGPTGTGKELCARAIHHFSGRRNFPFIPVDCAAIPDHLFENELFGHVRGAFTDARTDQKGLVALAQRGTLLLDEIDSLSFGAQAKLLRFLQERTYRPLGGDRFIKADVNVIAATNRDIEKCVDKGQFRADLYFRVAVLRIDMPALVERRGDIQVLARHFLEIHNLRAGRTRKSFSVSALRKLESYGWPGNVRELLNAVQRAAVFAEGSFVLPSDIVLPAADQGTDRLPEEFCRARSRAIEVFEKHYVETLLRKHNGNVTRAALEAGKDRRAFGRLKKKYRIDC